MTPVAAAIDLGVTPLAIDEAGVPRLLRGGAATRAMPAASATGSAVQHVERLAPAWGVAAAAVPDLESIAEVPVLGGTVVRLRQVIDGLAVDPSSGGELRVLVGKTGELVAASGKLIASDAPRTRTASAVIDDDASAVAAAVSDLYQTSVAPAALTMRSMAADGSRMLATEAGPVGVSLSRARKAWISDGDKLTIGYVVEAYSSGAATTDGDAYRTLVAADGRVLSRTNLKEDVAFNYRVYAETTGELHPADNPFVDSTPHAFGFPNTVPLPPYATPSLVSVEGLNHNPAGVADPWLAANRTETIGNNVEAYTDVNAPDGLTFGDFRATLTSTRTFDRTWTPALGAIESQSQQMAGITSLFYTINWLHDFWYDAGFTEAAGNAQNVNFGRGGEDRDAMNAEAEDNAIGGSRNNANMSTPADGMPPRMQVFIWDNKDDRSVSIGGRKPTSGPAQFGARKFQLSAPVVLADDGTTSDGGTTSDACQPLVAPVTGKIVLADRSVCSFKTQARNIQSAGGVAMLLANNVTAAAPPTLTDDAALPGPVAIGVMSVLQTEGAAIKADLAAGPVTAQIFRNQLPELEGTLDATVVSHEFGHYWHHRLSVCNTRLCGAMSEGWGDFQSLMLMARAGDNFAGVYPVGTFSVQPRANDPVYFGIRRGPYSTSTEVNGLSFRHMADGTPLPTGTPAHPFNPNANPNSEVHNGGEVWASIMWQGYSALLQQPGAQFATVRDKMRKYLVTALLISPTDSTPTEMRDAILTAVHNVSPADHDVLAAAYAVRGLGSCAVSPPRNSTNFVGIVESFEVKGLLAPGAATLASTARCDTDDVLDAGESARITVPVANPGPAALADVNVTLTTTTPGVHISRPTVAIGALASHGTASAAFTVSLDDTVTTAVAGAFTATITSSNGCNTTTSVPLAIGLNTDDVAQGSATETFNARSFAWTTTGTPGVWTHPRPTPLDGVLSGADATSPGDANAVSPPITAGGGPVTISFSHRFAFEANAANAFDGGVIEYSTDGGTTWLDISGLADPGYNVTLTGTPDVSGNPIAGRRAYGRTNASTPATDTVTLNLGTQLAGQTFRLRFRQGSDLNTGAAGWEIDNLAFTGIVGKPFPALVPDPGHCNAIAPTGPTDPGTGGGGHGGGSIDNTDQSAGCQAGGAGAGAGLVLGLLAVALRRRRR